MKKIVWITLILILISSTCWAGAAARRYLQTIAAAAGGLTCNTTTPWAQQTNIDDGYLAQQSQGLLSQKIQVSSSIQVCQVDAVVRCPYCTDSCYFAWYSSSNAGGTKYGGDSSSISVDNSYTWRTATFSTPVTVPSDAYLTLSCGTGDSGWAGRYDGTVYLDTLYDAFYGTTWLNPGVGSDYSFKVYTMQ